MPPTLARLLARPRVPGPMVSPASLGCSPTTWQTLCRDGVVVEVRPGFALVAGVSETSADRARTLLDAVPTDVVVAREWAVWVHTGGRPPRPPRRICVVYRPGTSRPRSVPGMDAVQATLRPWDVVTVGSLVVTSLERTAMDVATWSTGPQAVQDLARLRAGGADLAAAVGRLGRSAGWRGAERAVRRLESAERCASGEGSTAARRLPVAGSPPMVQNPGPGSLDRPPQACTTFSAALDPVMR